MKDNSNYISAYYVMRIDANDYKDLAIKITAIIYRKRVKRLKLFLLDFKDVLIKITISNKKRK